jgi:hypothetical protein
MNKADVINVRKKVCNRQQHHGKYIVDASSSWSVEIEYRGQA